MLEALRNWLTAPRTPLRLAILGVILCAPSLAAGFAVDDFAHRSAFLGKGAIADHVRSPIRMFSFSDGVPEHTRAVIDSGLYPWWTSETVLLNFWRPLTAATHAIDYVLWPNTPALMHAHNLFWFAIVILAAAALFRRVGMPAWPAGLAGLVFVLDESHGMPVAWIANRNALIALFFGLLCLIAHMRWRESGRLPWLACAMLLLTASVHANEGGIATCGYLFAYAVFLDKKNVTTKLATLVPYALVVFIWRASYTAGGFGALGSPTYIDPGATPIRFAVAMIQRAPVLLATQFTNMLSEPFDFLPPALRLAYLFVAIVALLVCAIALWPVLQKHPRARFFALGVALSAIPASSTFPSGRLLVFASVGGAALIGDYLIWALSAVERRNLLYRAVACLMIVSHFVIAPVALVGTSAGLIYLAHGMRDRFANLDYPRDIEERRLIFINAPNFFFTTYANIYRELEGLPVPEGAHILSPNAVVPARMTVIRVDEDTLRFEAEEGFRYMLFRDTDKPFHPGDRIELTHLTVEILETDAQGHAMKVNYHFPEPLESPKYWWMQVDLGMHFERYTPPGVGEIHTFYDD